MAAGSREVVAWATLWPVDETFGEMEMRRLALMLLALSTAVGGCAGVLPGPSEKAGPELSREQALARCMESTPAETPLYPDVVAACMEGYGWVYTSPKRP
jgi:hypothetical protein